MSKVHSVFQMFFYSLVMLLIMISLVASQHELKAKSGWVDSPQAQLAASNSLLAQDYLLWSASGDDIIQAIPISTVQSFIPNFSQSEYIEAGNTPSQIVLSQDGNHAYVSNKEDNTLSIVNLISKTREATITVGLHPFSLILSADEKYAYIVNRGMTEDNLGTIISQSVSIVNLTTKMEEQRIPLGAPADDPLLFPQALTDPLGIALSADEKTAYITDIQSAAYVIYVDLTTHTVTARVEIGELGYAFPVEIVRSDEFGIAYIAGGFSSPLIGIEDWWVAVFDLEAKQPLRKISLNPPCDLIFNPCMKINPRGLSLSPDGTKAYVASYSQGTLITIDLVQEKFLWSMTVGEQSEHMDLSQDGQRAYINDSATNTVFVVDISTQSIIAAIDIGRKPSAITVKDLVGYVTNIQNRSITVVNLNPPSIANQILRIDVGDVPKEVRVAPGNRYAYVSNLNSKDLSVVDLVTQKQVSTIKTEATSHQFAFSMDGKLAYVPDISSSGSLYCDDSTGFGFVRVYSLETHQLVKSLPTDECPFAAITSNGNVYVTSFGKDQLTIIDSATQTITGRIRTGTDPAYFAITQDGKQAYVANVESDSLSILDLATKTRSGTIAVGDGPRTIVLTKDESKAYVPNFESGTLSVVDLIGKKELTAIRVGKGAFGVTLSPDEKTAFVTAFRSNSIFVVDLVQAKVILIIPTAKEPLIIRYVSPPSGDAIPLPTPAPGIYLPLIRR